MDWFVFASGFITGTFLTACVLGWFAMIDQARQREWDGVEWHRRLMADLEPDPWRERTRPPFDFDG